MRIVFAGTPEFAVPILHALAAAHEVVAVCTRPDVPKGRGRALAPSEVAEAAGRLGIAVMKTASLKDPAAVEQLSRLAPEAICVAAFGLLLPPAVLELPPHGCINVHASLLPRWRGAAPVQRAILEGDEKTGVSIMRMEEGLDTGPVSCRVEVAIDDMDTETLTRRLADEGAAALLRVLEEVEAGTVRWTPQGEEGVTYAHKVTRADVALTPILPAGDLVRRVRASSRRVPSRALLAGREVTVLAAREAAADVSAGAVEVTDGRLLLGTARAALEVLRVVQAGRSPLDAADYIRGARLGSGALWEPVP